MKRSRASCSALLALAGIAELVCWGSVAHSSTFEPATPAVNITGSGHVDLRDPPLSFDFVADINFGPNRPASGGMNVALADGSVRFYNAVGGMLLEGNECLVFFLGGIPSGELDPTEPAIAVVREDPARPGAIFVKLQLKQVFPQTLDFEAPGDIRLIRERGPQPQARPWFSLYYPPQRVTVEGSDGVAGFSAWARARRDHSANGYLTLRIPDGPPRFRFEPLFAIVVPETETGPNYIVILTALAGAPLEIENLAVATVHADPQVPGCDIWDFTSNVDTRRSGSPLHIVFHAEGEIRLARGRGAAIRGRFAGLR
jgi:prepilin-type processing-associated H-X9-DG protein